MDFDSGFCFTLQVVKSSSEKIFSCEILLGGKLGTKIQCLSLLASCVPAEVEHTPLHFTLQKVSSCGVSWLISHWCQWKLSAPRTAYREGSEEGHCWKCVLLPGKC